MTNHDTRQNDPLAERVFGRIESEHIAPRPRWEFAAKNYLFWTLGVLAVALGALAVAATLFEITAVDWRLSVATHPDFFSFFFAAAPFLWVIALALFIIIGYVNVRRTKHGYRYPLAVIALGAVLTSLALGSALYAANLGGPIEAALGDHPPFYRPILLQERSWWSAPERGLLVGQVASVASDLSSFSLRDFSGREWTIDSSDLHTPDLTAIARGGIVRIVGLPVAASVLASTTMTVFHACFVFPWEAHGTESGPPPMPLAAFSSSTPRSATTTAAGPCQNIRPYQRLRSIESGN